MNVESDIQARSQNHCCSGKAIIITHCERVFVDLDIQYAIRMRHIILPSVACPAAQHFSPLSHKGTIFGGKKVIKRNNGLF